MDERQFDSLARKLGGRTDRRTILRSLIGGGAALAAIKAGSSVAAQADKVTICHWSEDLGYYEQISVSGNAVAAHEAHQHGMDAINPQFGSDPGFCGDCNTVCGAVDACTPARCDNGVCNVTSNCGEGESCNEGTGACDQTSSCLNNPQWTPVTCTTSDWVWSSDSSIAMDLQTANAAGVLQAGDQHYGIDSMCSLDGTGWVSTATFIMSGCDTSWWHIGGWYTGQCGGHDGDIYRHLALGPNDCYAY